ncbi:MAG: type II toxin-antitoxin system HicA family toxin [Candidatus Acidiferrales bacterium]
MRLPRDLSGEKLASLLGRHGYQTTRQTGSHLRLMSTLKGGEHHVTIPAHKALRVGTLGAILADVASYLQIDRDELVRDLFG